jgi:membrane protein implicated in regulation of membrane protease activity
MPNYPLMDPALAWAIIGLALVIVELLTGRLYLLMLGLAAFAAAGTAWLGYDLAVQGIVASVVAAVGCYALYANRGKNMPG